MNTRPAPRAGEALATVPLDDLYDAMLQRQRLFDCVRRAFDELHHRYGQLQAAPRPRGFFPRLVVDLGPLLGDDPDVVLGRGWGKHLLADIALIAAHGRAVDMWLEIPDAVLDNPAYATPASVRNAIRLTRALRAEAGNG
jgi:hypothetical protein